jgi:hypothetical protein
MEVITQRLDKRRSLGFAEEGMSCAELVEAFAPLEIDREYVLCAINGVPVARQYWPHVTPKRGTTVIVAIVPGKAGGKKNALALIASIAIAIAAPYAGAALANVAFAGVGGSGLVLGFGFTAGQVFGAAIGLVANMAVGALFKPSTPSISAANASSSAASSSPTYALAGQSNVIDPYGPVRRIFGTHRIYPVVVGRPYTEVYGDDQYLTTLYDIGAGDYEVSDVRIGASHIAYFQNASYFVHRNTKSPNLQWYYGARHDDQYNLLLADGAWHQVDTVVDTGWFTVALIFPTGLAMIRESDGATLANTARFNIEYSDYGVGNWTPVTQAASWSSSRPILSDGSAAIEFGRGELLRDEGVYGNPESTGSSDGLVRATTGRVQVYGYAPGSTSMTMHTVNGMTLLSGAKFDLFGVYYTTLNDVTPTDSEVSFTPPLQVEFVAAMQRASDGDWIEVYRAPAALLVYTGGGNYDVSDQRITQLALTVTVRPLATPLEGARYSIRVRQTAGQGDGRLVYGDMALVGVSSVSASAPAISLRNEHTLLELRVKANDQVSGTLEELSCFAQSYLFVNRGGTWFYETSRNPAWALWEILTGKMNKRPVRAEKLDFMSFRSWADYCDSIHPSTGAARACFDHVVDYYTTIFALAQTVTAAGRATLAPGDGLFRVLIDQPKTTPVQVFTPHNSKAFKGTRTFVEAPHAFRAKFMSEDTWKIEEMIVYNDGYAFGTASVFEQIELPGVTREGQVWCDARYRMAQGIHRQESWSLDVDWENLICTRGDLVHVAHDVPKLGGLPSRIKEVHYNPTSGLATSWELTEPVDLLGTPSAFGFTIRTISGIVHQGQFAAQYSPTHVAPVTAIGGLSVGDLHVWGEMDHITYPFLVATVVPQSDAAATLTLVPYAGDAIFGADSGAIPPYDPVVDDDLATLAPPPIPLVTLFEKIEYTNRRPQLSISFDWRNYVAPTFVVYEVWLTWDLNPSAAPVLIGRTNAPHFEWISARDLVANRNYVGTHYCVQVLGVNSFGAKRTLAETPLTCSTIPGDVTKPAAPPSFELDLKRDTITLAWEHPSDPDIDYYEIRFVPLVAGATFAQSTLLAPQIPYPTRSFDVPARLGTYYIKTVDTSGNRSDEFAAAFTPGENVWQLNVIATWNDQPAGWLGSKNGFAVIGGDLESQSLGLGTYVRRAEYYYKDIYDGGAIFQTRFTSKITAGGVAANSIMATWLPLASADPLAGSVVLDTGGASTIPELIDVYHELRWVTVEGAMSSWTPLASAVPIGFGSANFGAWRRFQVGDYIGRYFQFRLVSEYIGPDAVADVGAVIDDAIIEIDMTDRIDGHYDVACPAGGLHITYAPAFAARPVVSITPDNAVSGDRFTVSNSDRFGFDIKFFNSAGTGVARQFDWLAKGYGAQSAGVIDALVLKGTRKPKAFVSARRIAA